MILFDFISPHIIYIVYLLLTLLTILSLFYHKEWWVKYHTNIILVWLVLLLYSHIVRYGISIWEGNPSYPFFPSRIAALSILLYCMFPRKIFQGFVFFIASTSLLPVFLPMGAIDMISLLDETFFIDHYIGAIFPFYLLSIKKYNPQFKAALFTAFFVLITMIIYLILDHFYTLGSYYFMHDGNPVITWFPQINWILYTVLFSFAIFIYYCIYALLGKVYHNKASEA